MIRRFSLPLRLAVAACGALAMGACGGTAGETSPGPAPSSTPIGARTWSPDLETRASGAQPLVPIGYGTLSQDDITVLLRSGGLQIKVVPLSEWVIRLTAPDTYARLNGYKVSRSEEVLRLAARQGERGWPLVALVTFFSQEVEERFEPYDLQIENQSRIYRPFDIIGVTPGFGRDRLNQQETQVALYLFPSEIDLNLPTTVRYGSASSNRWDGIRSTLDSEVARVNSRAGAGQP